MDVCSLAGWSQRRHAGILHGRPVVRVQQGVACAHSPPGRQCARGVYHGHQCVRQGPAHSCYERGHRINDCEWRVPCMLHIAH